MIIKRFRPFILIAFLFFAGSLLYSQIKVSGFVVDENLQPIHFATILLKGTKTGTITDNTGFYSISTSEKVDSIIISAVSYHRKVYPVRKGEQIINATLLENIYQLHEVRIKPGENPAHRIIRNIIKNKVHNDPANYGSYTSRVYNKIEIDLKNINKPTKDRKLWRQVGFIFDNLDSTELENVPYLPVFLTETLSDYYHTAADDKTREVIVASKISGVRSATLTRFTGNFYQNFNVYKNYINVENIGLISPVNDQALLFYKYHLIDSIDSHPHKLYRIDFTPRMSQDPAFTGSMWVVDSVFALHKIHLNINERVNINFLNDLQIQKYFIHNGSRYVPSKEEVFADFDIEGNRKNRTIGLLGRKTTIYENFVFGEPPSEVMELAMQTQVNEDAMDVTDEFWKLNRPEELNKREATIYNMVDSLQSLPVFKRATEFFETLFFGYKDVGYVELGPYYYAYSYNPIEGNRIRLGGRTTKEFHSKIRLDGYAAYGFKDEGFKYSIGAYYYLKKEPFRRFNINYEHDYQLLGRSINAFTEDNFLSAAISLTPNNKLTLTDRLSGEYVHEWFSGLTSRLDVQWQRIHPGPFVPFYLGDSTLVKGINNSEIGLNTRIAIGEAHIPGDFERISMGSKKPIFNVYAGFGHVEMNNTSNYYGRLSFDMSDKIFLNPLGYTQIYLQGGMIFGSVPFPLLKLHEGNETIKNDMYAYNLMNYYEFASDRYASIFLEHHLQGFFLNKIPLFRRLKWREVVGFKALYGTLDKNRHRDVLFTPGLTGLEGKPYLETSAGIENILRFFRVDAVWRLSHRNHIEDVPLWGLKVSLHVHF